MISRHFSVTPPQRLIDLNSHDARLILAARSWCILRGAGRDPMPRLQACFLCSAAATRFALLMDAVQQMWPEPFAIHRPCCPTASLDEALLSGAVRLAGTSSRPAFDSLLHEMLGGEARDLLYVRARLLYRHAGFMATSAE